MDDHEAYLTLAIDAEAPQNLDNNTILAVYQARLDETRDAARLENLQNAITAIALARGYTSLESFGGGRIRSFEQARPDWPIGLENIGNTCYLNSLLQCYFSIKPLRDLVLDIDSFMTDFDEATLNSKRVGSRFLSRNEVARSQQCKQSRLRSSHLLMHL